MWGTWFTLRHTSLFRRHDDNKYNFHDKITNFPSSEGSHLVPIPYLSPYIHAYSMLIPLIMDLHRYMPFVYNLCGFNLRNMHFNVKTKLFS